MAYQQWTRPISMRTWVQSLASLSGLNDPALLWLWFRPVATALQLWFNPLAWEFPYATGAALKRQKKKVSDSPRLYYHHQWWILLYHGPSYSFSWLNGYFPRGLFFTKILCVNFSQVIPELQDKVSYDFYLPTFSVWLHIFYFPNSSRKWTNSGWVIYLVLTLLHRCVFLVSFMKESPYIKLEKWK